jgi:hypothetical protein
MRGEIAICETVVKYNNMGWGVFDFFKSELRQFTTNRTAGWYAYILRDGVFHFKWTEGYDRFPSDKYLNSLKEDGWNVGINPTVIEDTFTHD